MERLISIRTNILYTKEGEDYKKLHEIVFLVDSPAYKFSNTGEVVKERQIKELRFGIGDENLGALIELLTHLKNAKEEDLT